MNAEQRERYKSVKQNLSLIQLKIKKDLKAGIFPVAEDTDLFISTSEEMKSLSGSEWRESMDNYMHVLAEFQKAINSQNQQAVQENFQRLLDSKVACHKKFR